MSLKSQRKNTQSVTRKLRLVVYPPLAKAPPRGLDLLPFGGQRKERFQSDSRRADLCLGRHNLEITGLAFGGCCRFFCLALF
jgi:hypothetical protein